MMSTARTVAVFAIIVGCFAVLYPRIFHPFVLRIFGGQKTSGSDMPQYPPGHGRRPEMPRRPGEGDDLRSHIRPGPHPGMRAAAEMRQQQQQQAGSGRGMMGVVLPMYAVGIVLYLIYTVVKVFSRQERNQSDTTPDQGVYNYEKREGKFTFGDDFEGEDDYKDFMSKKEKQKELEKLLMKADERHITEFEMRQLQKRLEETEAQMTRILQAMQNVTEKVDDQTAQKMPDKNDGKEETGQKIETEADSKNAPKKEESQENKTDNVDKEDKSGDSSPDTDSFEVVSKTGSSSFSVISTPTDEETPAIVTQGETSGVSDTTPASDQMQRPSESDPSVWEGFEKNETEDDIDVLSTSKAEIDEIETENIGAFPEDILLDKEKDTEESSVRQRKPKEL